MNNVCLLSFFRWCWRQRKGFTLLEMLIVMGVILVLVAIAVPNYMNVLDRSRNVKCRTNLLSYKTAVAAYYTDTRQWPESGSEHLYHILSGIYPFDRKLSTKFNPPYLEFGSDEGGRKDYQSLYDGDNKDSYQIQFMNTPTGSGSDLNPVAFSDFPLSKYSADGLQWRPLLDPWEQPIVYISPKLLRELFEKFSEPAQWTPELQAWRPFIAVSDETSYDRVNDRIAYIPFGMNSGQFWSVGKDGLTARGNETWFGTFQPGNLSPLNNRDDDEDGLSDVNDMSRGKGNPILEDDINSWD